MVQAFFYNTAIGEIGLAERDGAVAHVFFGSTVAPQRYELCETPLLQQAAAELQAYFAGQCTAFSVPLAPPQGTAFEQAVWAALQTIPYGETRSYAQIAAQAGSPKAMRAVGRANSRNPLSILIPCHRVIGANGSLTGYAGGLELKRHLLELERTGKPLRIG